jgi:hypothetical protein
VGLASLCPASPSSRYGPYRPTTFPASATGPTARSAWSRSRREQRKHHARRKTPQQAEKTRP